MEVDLVMWISSRLGDYDMLVIDELSLLKNRASQRFKYLSKHTAKRVVGLTGTPVANNYLDLWAQCQIVDPKILDMGYFQYRKEFFYEKR